MPQELSGPNSFSDNDHRAAVVDCSPELYIRFSLRIIGWCRENNGQQSWEFRNRILGNLKSIICVSLHVHTCTNGTMHQHCALKKCHYSQPRTIPWNLRSIQQVSGIWAISNFKYNTSTGRKWSSQINMNTWTTGMCRALHTCSSFPSCWNKDIHAHN